MTTSALIWDSSRAKLPAHISTRNAIDVAPFEIKHRVSEARHIFKMQKARFSRSGNALMLRIPSLLIMTISPAQYRARTLRESDRTRRFHWQGRARRQCGPSAEGAENRTGSRMPINSSSVRRSIVGVSLPSMADGLIKLLSFPLSVG